MGLWENDIHIQHHIITQIKHHYPLLDIVGEEEIDNRSQLPPVVGRQITLPDDVMKMKGLDMK